MRIGPSRSPGRTRDFSKQHAEVAALPPENADAILNQAQAEEMATRAVRAFGQFGNRVSSGLPFERWRARLSLAFAPASYMLRGEHGGDMIFYRFHEKEGPRVVITNDITGANLPKIEGGWKADGLTEVIEGGARRLGTDTREIIDTIEREGFFMGSVHDV